MLARLSKLLPGKTMTLAGILTGGEVTTVPQEMAQAVTTHWQKVFDDKAIEHEKATEF